MVDYDMQCTVYVFGSSVCKVGFSGDDAPRAVFPAIVGRPRRPGIMVGMDAKDCFVGDEAQAKSGILRNKHPIPCEARGEINWNGVEKLLHHTPYNELCITPEEHPLMMTSFPQMKFNEIEKLTSIIFETFNNPAFYLSDTGTLSLYSTGRTTGVTLDVGAGHVTACSHYENIPIHHTKFTLEDQTEKKRKRIGGSLLTDVFVDISNSKNNNIKFETTSEKEIAKSIKEQYCFVNLDEAITSFNDDSSISNKKKEDSIEYEMPDGQKISLGDGLRKYAPEILFQPKLIGYNLPGVHKLLMMSIKNSPKEIRPKLYQNIVLSGGTSLMKNFRERITWEIKKICPVRYKDHVNVIESSDKKKGHAWWISSYENEKKNKRADTEYRAWVGGSILSSLSTFTPYWISKDEYDDAGATITHRKCWETVKWRNHVGVFLGAIDDLDLDVVERREYVLYDYPVESRHVFTIKMSGCEDFIIRFKSFLYL